jgi:hypothetical protein
VRVCTQRMRTPVAPAKVRKIKSGRTESGIRYKIHVCVHVCMYVCWYLFVCVCDSCVYVCMQCVYP